MSFDGGDIDGLLQAGVEGGAWHGVVAVVVDRDGVLYEGAAGQAGPQTMFRNASMTKAVATTGALQLVEQGKLDLDATVESVLPEFGELQLIEGFDGDRPILRAPATKPTFRQLMTHTAGLGYFFINERLFEYFGKLGTGEPARRQEGEPATRRSSTTLERCGSTASTPTGSGSRSSASPGVRSRATWRTTCTGRSA